MASSQSAPGTVLITGTTSGVGLYATKALVDRGWKVIAANRSTERAEEAAVRIGLPVGRPNQLQHIELDLSDLNSVRSGVKDLLDRLDKSGGLTLLLEIFPIILSISLVFKAATALNTGIVYSSPNKFDSFFP